MRSKLADVCIYCGATTKLTVDHVPPRNLFSKPRPTLITVTACECCNSGFSKDDDHFRYALVFRDDLQDNVEIQRLLPEVLSAYLREENARFAKTFHASTRVVEEVATDGTILIKHQFLVNQQRMNAVARRIVRGLFYHEFDRVLSCHVDSFFDPFRFEMIPNLQAVFPAHSILKSLREEPLKTVHDKVFSFRFIGVDGSPDTSVWYLVFFERVEFLVFVNCEMIHTRLREIAASRDSVTDCPLN